MNCNRHFLNFHWEHHDWRRRVLSTEYVPTQENNMWGRTVYGRSVRCDTQYVCAACGETRGDAGCICDTEEGERCAIRLTCLEAGPPRDKSYL